jgi:16S rRNA (guanine527-N7)-methyltransferase
MDESDDAHPDRVPVSRPEPIAPPIDPGLRVVLERSRARGLLGHGGIEQHVRNARVFAAAIEANRAEWPERLLDLGAGGGVPGLVLAVEHAVEQVVLLDSARRRIDVLRAAVDELGLGSRVELAHGRAEDLARTDALRGRFDVVTSRSFGPPSATAECAVGFLHGPGSQLLVSEPPEERPDRWPDDGLAPLGLRATSRYEGDGATVQVLEAVATCDERFPRRAGVPTRRPLF